MRNKNNENYFQKNNTVITGESRSKVKQKTSDDIELEIQRFIDNGGSINVIATTDAVPGSRKVNVQGILN